MPGWWCASPSQNRHWGKGPCWARGSPFSCWGRRWGSKWLLARCLELLSILATDPAVPALTTCEWAFAPSSTLPFHLHLQGPAGTPGPEGRQGEKGAKVGRGCPGCWDIPFIFPPRCSSDPPVHLPHAAPLWGRGSLYSLLPLGLLRFQPYFLSQSTLDSLPPPALPASAP